MVKLSKKQKLAREKVDSNSLYSLSDASSLVREISSTKFDSSVDLALNLGVDPKKSRSKC